MGQFSWGNLIRVWQLRRGIISWEMDPSIMARCPTIRPTIPMAIFRPMIFNTQAQLWTTYLKGRDSKRGKTTSSKEPMKTTKRNMELSHGQMKMEKMNILEVSIKMENFMEKENSSKKESDYTRESLKMERSTDKGSSSKTME